MDFIQSSIIPVALDTGSVGSSSTQHHECPCQSLSIIQGYIV